MPRRTARIGQDEVARMVRAAKACKLPIARIVFDGDRVSVVIGESEENEHIGVDGASSKARVHEVDVL